MEQEGEIVNEGVFEENVRF